MQTRNLFRVCNFYKYNNYKIKLGVNEDDDMDKEPVPGMLFLYIF